MNLLPGAAAQREHALTAALLAVLLCWEVSGGDLALAAWFGGPQGFPARQSFWASAVLHQGGRWLAGAALAAAALAAWRGTGSSLPASRRWAWWLAVVAVMILVPALKQLSRSSCPWDLQLFGGVATYVPHWLLARTDGGPGGCFPAGHPVAAFAFMPLYFQWRDERPLVARALLAGSVALGFVFGLAQVARGAHFASHVLWSGWLCWTASALVARWMAPDQPASAALRAGQP